MADLSEAKEETEDTLGLSRMSFAGGLVSGTISLAIACALMAVIERYLPQLFGKKLGKAI